MERLYALQCNLFQTVVDVNNVVKATDTEEVLHGDNHASNATFHKIEHGAVKVPVKVTESANAAIHGSTCSSGSVSEEEYESGTVSTIQ